MNYIYISYYQDSLCFFLKCGSECEIPEKSLNYLYILLSVHSTFFFFCGSENEIREKNLSHLYISLSTEIRKSNFLTTYCTVQQMK